MAERVLVRTNQSTSTAYILASCRRARYPSLCFKCLSSMARRGTTIQTPHQLAQAALAVALQRAVRTRDYMVNVSRELDAKRPKVHDYQAIRDCTDQLNDGVYQMSQSIIELRRITQRQPPAVGRDFFFLMSNVETWVSTTITDAMMCVEQFPGRRTGKVKATIKGKVLNVAMTASNALYLFHSYASKYAAARGMHMP
ncbi:hypothetical protein SAY86_007029 [Trapa natans]|nr:hypothetical protein SAY86_007029 [Trapa natans]